MEAYDPVFRRICREDMARNVFFVAGKSFVTPLNY